VNEETPHAHAHAQRSRLQIIPLSFDMTIFLERRQNEGNLKTRPYSHRLRWDTITTDGYQKMALCACRHKGFLFRSPCVSISATIRFGRDPTHTHTHTQTHFFIFANCFCFIIFISFCFPVVALLLCKIPPTIPPCWINMIPSGVVGDSVGRQRPDQGQTRADQGRAGPRQGAAGEPGTAAGWKEGTQNQRDTRRLLQLACVGGTPTVRCGRLAGWLVDMYFSVYLLGTLPTYPRAKFATYAFFTQALAQDQAQAPWILFLPVRIDCVLYGCVH
jgi:hypothetical protein